MSEENVEVGEPVRRLWAALSRRDWDAFSAELDPEMEYTPVEEQVVYRGPEAATRYAERWVEAWETFSAEVEEVESAPAADRVFVALRFRGRGTGSGVEIDERGYWVYELRGGRLYRISEYSDPAEALEAAGLSESQK
jgi:ketosteroid isomerase-like protein